MASAVQAGRLTGAGQTGTIGVDGATSKVEVQVCEPQASVTVYVKVRLVPAHEALAGRAGTVPILVVARLPPV